MSGFGQGDGYGEQGAGLVELDAVTLVAGSQAQCPHLLPQVRDQTALT